MNLRDKKSIKGARIQISGSSNQIAFPGPTSRIVQSDRSDGLSNNKSYRSIRSLGRTQDQKVGSSNQIALAGPTSRTDQSELFLRTNFLYRPLRALLRTFFPYCPIRSLRRTIFPYRPIRSFLRTIFLYRPIRSLGASPAEITKRSSHSHGHGPHELTRARSPSLKPTCHSNDIRSHERDGRNLKKKSPRKKFVLLRTQ